MTRTGSPWSRLFRKRRTVTLGDELAQCLSNGIDYEAGPDELCFPKHANDNPDTFRTVPGFGAVPYRSKVNGQDRPQ